MYCQLFNSMSSLILELSVKFVSEICHENINKPLDAAYLADFGIDITSSKSNGHFSHLVLIASFTSAAAGFYLQIAL